MNVAVDEGAAVAAVREALARVVDPCSIATGVPITVEEMGLLERVTADADGAVLVELRLTSPFCFQAVNIVERIDEVTADLEGVSSVRVEIDPAAEWMPDMMTAGPRDRLRQVRPLA